MRAMRPIGLSLVLASFFAVGLYGAPIARSAYARLFPEPAFVEGDYSSLHGEAGSPVVLFSTSTCPYCKKTREFFASKGISYVEYETDTSDSALKKFKDVGGGAVPLIYIGDRRIRGFREDAIKDALAHLDPRAAPPGT